MTNLHHSDSEAEFVTERDRGKLWLIATNGGGKADMQRERSQRQHAWLAYAVSMGWLTRLGYLTTEGKMLAQSYEDEAA